VLMVCRRRERPQGASLSSSSSGCKTPVKRP
jgi:hypothetical protein